MGPFPPPALNDANLPEHRPALKWLDDCKDIKEKLKTNLSSEDLNLKDLDSLKPITVHREHKKSHLKPAIKKFVLDVNQLTGIKNFTDIAKDPYKIPADRELDDETASPQKNDQA
jgi:hypothetical protein